MEEKKISPIVKEHWKKKFEKSIYVLLQSGVKTETLIEEIKIIDNLKDKKI